MSLISTIYFSKKNIESLSDLENDKEALVADFSSRGFGHPALMFDELGFLSPKDFSKYTEKVLIEVKESYQLIRLTPDFISNCEKLTYDDLQKINEKINQHFKDISFKNINKLSIDNLPKIVRIFLGLMVVLALVLYTEFKNPMASIFTIVISIIIPILFLRKLKSDKRKFIQSENFDFIPQLRKLVNHCKEARHRNSSVFYYWSL